jgi:hypothetical protein
MIRTQPADVRACDGLARLRLSQPKVFVMTMLYLQILLLMLAAYFVGAALACMLRKLVEPAVTSVDVGARAPVVARPVEPLPQATRTVAPATVSRFEKALVEEPPRPAPTPAVAPPPPRATPSAPVVAAPVVTAPVVAAPPVVAKTISHPVVEAPHPAPPADIVVPPPPRITLTPPAAPPPPAAPVTPVAVAAPVRPWPPPLLRPPLCRELPP